jgi:hypothetical protein
MFYCFRKMTLAAVFGALAVAGQPMTFKLTGNFQEVLAQGEITADTPAAFSAFLRQNTSFPGTVMFNSLGGDLIAALELGREIRLAGWSTTIGTPGLSFLSHKPGECDSACTFAFLGGKIRSIAPGSLYGVHRFWGTLAGDIQQSTQKIAGDLVAYIREMGVSAEMYTLMTQGEPDHVKYLDAATMTRLRITTVEVVDVKMADEKGIAVLHVSDEDSGRRATYGHMDFYCNGPSLLARVYFPRPLTIFNPSQVALEWGFYTLASLGNERKVAIPPKEYRYRGQDNESMWIDVNITPALLRDWILPANSMEVSLTKNPGSVFPLVQWDRVGSVGTPLPATFRTLVQTLQRSCQ